LNDDRLLHFVWEEEASRWIDKLVDLDIRYLALQLAIEAVIRAGIILDYSVPIVIRDKVVYVHRVPEFFSGMLPLVVLYTDDGAGTIIIESIEFVS
jgi:hypothetical protein